MRALAVVLLTVLVMLAGGFPGEAGAGFSKVKYTLTVTYTESGAGATISESEGRQSWKRGVSSDAYVLKGAFPFWITRSPGAKPTFSGGTDLVGTSGYGLMQSSAGWPGHRHSEWAEWLFPPGGLRGSASLRGTGSPRVSFGFTINELRRPSVITHYEDGTTNTLNGMWSSGKSGMTHTVDLSRNFGRAFIAKASKTESSTACGKPGYSGAPVPVSCFSYRLGSATLAFTPVGWVAERKPGKPAQPKPEEKKPERQRWQVDVRGTDQWRWGVLTGLGAGVDVDWLHRTILETKGGRIVSAIGKVSIQNVRGFSQPPGVFTVTPTKTKTWPQYTLPSATKAKGSNRVTLMTYDRRIDSSSEYLLRYAIRLTGPQALDIIRKAGLPDPEVLYARLVERGPVVDSVTPFVPDPARLVFLLQEKVQPRPTELFDKRVSCPKQLSEQACFLNRGGQIITVTRLR